MTESIFTPMRDENTPPTYGYFDGVTWKKGKNNKTIEVVSPIDQSVVGKLQCVDRSEIDEVIALAHASQPAWEGKPLSERVKIMHLAADWMRHVEPYLTALLVREIGKTTKDAKSEILRTADIIDYVSEEVLSMKGETVDSDNFPGFDKGRIAFVDKVAHGVVLCISPFNYPINLAATKIVPALLMGNAVIFKPATQGGISGLHFIQILVKSGVPNGVLSAVTGKGSEIGDYLTKHTGINMIAYTGGSDIGLHIAEISGMIPLLFECGGNNPAIVLPDADMEVATDEIIKGAFSYSGQRCTAIKYVLGMSQTIETLIGNVLLHMKNMVLMGDPRSPETKLVGPVISKEAAIIIGKSIDDAVAGGAKILLGGKIHDSFVEPTILTDVKPDMQIVKKEVFGPVLSFITVGSIDEGVAIINASVYGLQASVFTKDEGSGMSIGKTLHVGTVQVNGSPQRGPDHFPFMGIKNSGIGVQGARYSLEAMGRLRSLVINKPA